MHEIDIMASQFCEGKIGRFFHGRFSSADSSGGQKPLVCTPMKNVDDHWSHPIEYRSDV